MTRKLRTRDENDELKVTWPGGRAALENWAPLTPQCKVLPAAAPLLGKWKKWGAGTEPQRQNPAGVSLREDPEAATLCSTRGLFQSSQNQPRSCTVDRMPRTPPCAASLKPACMLGALRPLVLVRWGMALGGALRISGPLTCSGAG